MPSPDERGLARERTGLAWERTALGFGALSAVMLGVAAHHGRPGLIAVTVALVAVAFATWRHGHGSYKDTTVAPQARALWLVALAIALTAVAAAVIVIAD
jgi:inner membrane protein YidH